MIDEKTKDLCEMLVLRAKLAREAKSIARREKIVKSLSQTANELVKPKFDQKKLRDALNSACVERPDFGDPVVMDTKHNKVHLNGTFDLDTLAYNYFVAKGEMIDA